MQHQTAVTVPQEMVHNNRSMYIDLLSTSLFARITNIWVGFSLKHAEDMPLPLIRLQNQLRGRITEFNAAVRDYVPTEGQNYFSGLISDQVLYDLSLLLENFVRISKEENAETYHEFTEMVIGLIDDVFYSAQNRKKIYFNKYKALFELIRSELKADVNGTRGKLLFEKGELYIRTGNEQSSTQVKL